MNNKWDEIFGGEGFCVDINPREFVTGKMEEMNRLQ